MTKAGPLLWLGLTSSLAVTTVGCEAGRGAPPLPPDELAPTGVLRIAVGVGTATSAFWATPDSAGLPRGVTVDLGHALGVWAGLPVELVLYPNSGSITEAGLLGEWDVTFMPVDEARAQVVDFGPAYYLSDSGILVPEASAAKTLSDVNQEGVQVAVIRGTTTARAVAALLPAATMLYYDEVDVMLDDVRAGLADAVALGRESVLSLVPVVPGSRVLEEGYNETGVAVAVPKGRGQALAYVTVFIEEAKTSGLVRNALKDAGLVDTEPAPPAIPR